MEAVNIKRINSNGSSESSDSRTSSSSGRFAPAMSFDNMTVAIPGDGSPSPISGAKPRSLLQQQQQIEHQFENREHKGTTRNRGNFAPINHDPELIVPPDYQLRHQHANPSTSSPSEKLDPLTAKLRKYRREMEESEAEFRAQQIKGQAQSLLEEEETTNLILDKMKKWIMLSGIDEVEETEAGGIQYTLKNGDILEVAPDGRLAYAPGGRLDRNGAPLVLIRPDLAKMVRQHYDEPIPGVIKLMETNGGGIQYRMKNENILEETPDGGKYYVNEGKIIRLDKQNISSSSSGLEAPSKGKGRSELAQSLLASGGGKMGGSATASSSQLAQSLLSGESKSRLVTEKETTTSNLAQSLLNTAGSKAPSQARVSRPESMLANSKAASLEKRSELAQSLLASSASTTVKKSPSSLLAQSLLTGGASKSRPTAESLLSGESHSISLLSNEMAKLVSPPDVKQIQETEAGGIQYTLKNGDILEVAPNGRLAYAPGGRLDRNGAPLELIRPDLAKILRANLRPLPSIVEITETFAHGIQYKMTDGKILEVTADGTICYENEEGKLVKITKRQKEQQQPLVHSLLSPGKKEQPQWWWQPPYGEVKKGQETRSGGLQFNMKDGTLWEAKRDGRIFWRNANGEVIEMSRDGTPKKINKPLPSSESSTHSKGAVQSILAVGHRQAPANANVSLMNHPAQSLLSNQHTNDDGTMVQGGTAGSSFRTTGLVLPPGKTQHGLVLNNPNTILRFEHSLIENKDDDDNYEGNRHHRNMQHYQDDFEEHGSADDKFFKGRTINLNIADYLGMTSISKSELKK